jgi:hypothetical protein
MRDAAWYVLPTMEVLGGRLVDWVAFVPADLVAVDDEVAGVLDAVGGVVLDDHDLVDVKDCVLVEVGGAQQSAALVVAFLFGRRDIGAFETQLAALAPALLPVEVDVHALGVGEGAANPLDRGPVGLEAAHVLDEGRPNMPLEPRDRDGRFIGGGLHRVERVGADPVGALELGH